MTLAWHNVAGMVGVGLIILTYLLLTAQRMRSDGWQYPAFNGLGAALVLVSLLVDFNLSAFIVEAFWAVISLAGLVRWFRSRA